MSDDENPSKDSVRRFQYPMIPDAIQSSHNRAATGKDSGSFYPHDRSTSSSEGGPLKASKRLHWLLETYDKNGQKYDDHAVVEATYRGKDLYYSSTVKSVPAAESAFTSSASDKFKYLDDEQPTDLSMRSKSASVVDKNNSFGNYKSSGLDSGDDYFGSHSTTSSSASTSGVGKSKYRDSSTDSTMSFTGTYGLDKTNYFERPSSSTKTSALGTTDYYGQYSVPPIPPYGSSRNDHFAEYDFPKASKTSSATLHKSGYTVHYDIPRAPPAPTPSPTQRESYLHYDIPRVPTAPTPGPSKTEYLVRYEIPRFSPASTRCPSEPDCFGHYASASTSGLDKIKYFDGSTSSGSPTPSTSGLGKSDYFESSSSRILYTGTSGSIRTANFEDFSSAGISGVGKSKNFINSAPPFANATGFGKNKYFGDPFSSRNTSTSSTGFGSIDNFFDSHTSSKTGTSDLGTTDFFGHSNSSMIPSSSTSVVDKTKYHSYNSFIVPTASTSSFGTAIYLGHASSSTSSPTMMTHKEMMNPTKMIRKDMSKSVTKGVRKNKFILPKHPLMVNATSILPSSSNAPNFRDGQLTHFVQFGSTDEERRHFVQFGSTDWFKIDK